MPYLTCGKAMFLIQQQKAGAWLPRSRRIFFIENRGYSRFYGERRHVEGGWWRGCVNRIGNALSQLPVQVGLVVISERLLAACRTRPLILRRVPAGCAVAWYYSAELLTMTMLFTMTMLSGFCREVCWYSSGPLGLFSDTLRACAQPLLSTNMRLKFQAMVTRLHSPRTLSRPRSRN